MPDISQPTVTADPHDTLDEASRAGVADGVRRAGLALMPRQFDIAGASSPLAAALLARLRRPRGFDEQPANRFGRP